MLVRRVITHEVCALFGCTACVSNSFFPPLFAVLPSADAYARREVTTRLVSVGTNMDVLTHLETNPVNTEEEDAAFIQLMADMPPDEGLLEVFGSKAREDQDLLSISSKSIALSRDSATSEF